MKAFLFLFMLVAFDARATSVAEGSAEAHFVIVGMDITDVEKMLPAELKLANPGKAYGSKKHPVLFMLADQTGVKLSALPFSWGVDYLEFMVGIPFVYHEGDPKKIPRQYVPQSYLDHSILQKLSSFYGFAREKAYMNSTGTEFEVYSSDQSVHYVQFEVTNTGNKYSGKQLKPVLKYIPFLKQPLMGQKSNGDYVCSLFNWKLEHSGSMTETEGDLKIETEFLSGLAKQNLTFTTPLKSLFSSSKKLGFFVKSDWEISVPFQCY